MTKSIFSTPKKLGSLIVFFVLIALLATSFVGCSSEDVTNETKMPVETTQIKTANTVEDGHDHTPVEELKGSCAMEGWYKYNCPLCGEKTVSTNVNDNNHEGPIRMTGTPDMDHVWYVCESCGNKVNQEHDHTPIEERKGSCTVEGWVTINCPLCGVKTIDTGIDSSIHSGPIRTEHTQEWDHVWEICEACGGKV